MAHDVFISYSAHDKTIADAVCATLENRKIRCWIAPRDVLPGIPYAEALIDGINKSRLLILVFSNNSNKSPQVMREVERAVNKGIPIITLRIEDVNPSKSMEFFLSAPHWLDAMTPPIEQHLQKLASTVELLLNAEVPLKPEEGSPNQIAYQAKTKSKIKHIYIIAGVVVIALIGIGVLFTNGNFKGIFKNSTTGISGNSTQIGSTTSTLNSSSQGLVGQTTTSLNATTSAIIPLTILTTSATTNAGKVPTALISGNSIQGNFSFAGEIDFFTFDAQIGDSVHIILTKGSKDSTVVPFLGLIDPDGQVLFDDYSRGLGGYATGGPVQIDMTVSKNGRYTVKAKSYSLVTGQYTLAFALMSKTDNPISLGSIQSQFTFAGQVILYTFNAKSGDSVDITMAKGANDSPIIPWLGLLGPDGSVINEGYAESYGVISGGPFEINMTIPQTGKYIIRVRDNSLLGGLYTLSFNLISKP